MLRADPRHSFGQFRQETSGLFGTGNGGIKLLETAMDARRTYENSPRSLSSRRGPKLRRK
jgi:hypothetical protein